MREPLQEAPKFRRWQGLLQQNGLDIHHVEEVFTRPDYQGRALFSIVMLDAHTPEGDKIPPICFIKGMVATIVICLIDERTQEKYLLLVKQRRICSGGYIYEHVAGLVDGKDSPKATVIREAVEEAGVSLSSEAVYALNEEPLYPSTGTSDEAMFIFFSELTLPKAQIMAYDGQRQGLISEHERIITHVVPLEEAKRLVTNTNGLLAIYLYLEAMEKKTGLL
ncbi:MAG: NUDIX hydrolase [Bacteroidota bacterium]